MPSKYRSAASVTLIGGVYAMMALKARMSRFTAEWGFGREPWPGSPRATRRTQQGDFSVMSME